MQTEPNITNVTSFSIIMTKKDFKGYFKSYQRAAVIRDIKVEQGSVKP